MPLRVTLGVGGAVAGRRLGALEGGGYPPLPMHPWGGGGAGRVIEAMVWGGPSVDSPCAPPTTKSYCMPPTERHGASKGGGDANGSAKQRHCYPIWGFIWTPK